MEQSNAIKERRFIRVRLSNELLSLIVGSHFNSSNRIEVKGGTLPDDCQFVAADLDQGTFPSSVHVILAHLSFDPVDPSAMVPTHPHYPMIEIARRD